MSADVRSRRGFLRASTIALGAGLAGCLGSLLGTESTLERQLETVREATTT